MVRDPRCTGTAASYNRGCRCDDCRDAIAAKQRAWRDRNLVEVRRRDRARRQAADRALTEKVDAIAATVGVSRATIHRALVAGHSD